MKIGSVDITNCKIGSVQVNSVYIGSTLVWQYLDADALAFITAAGITDATQISAIDTLVKSLKTASLWTKLIAFYPFVGGTATTHKFNLKDPRDLDAAYRIVFAGGMTHNANGITGNSLNAYGDTKFSEATTYTDLGLFAYSGVNAGNNNDFLLGESAANILLNPRNASDILSIRLYAGGTDTVASTDSSKFFSMNRRGGTTVDAQYETIFTTFSRSVVGTTNTVFLLRSSTNYASRNLRSAGITRGFTQADYLSLRTINLTFQTALSRNV